MFGDAFCTIATVRYQVDAKPGPQHHRAFIQFENVSDELRGPLMRIRQMLPGDPFDESHVSSFIVRVEKEDNTLRTHCRM